MRLIDADKLHYNRIRIAHSDGTVGGYNAVVMSAEIKDAPTVDAVPVVRCKDCKYSCANYSIIKKETLLFCYHDFQGSYVDDNFYCAHGKRKDETEEGRIDP